MQGHQSNQPDSIITQETIPEPRPATVEEKRRLLGPRVNVIEQVYYQAPQSQPVLVETRMGFMVTAEEEPYQRNNIRIDLPWQQIDIGWMRDKPISQLVISNPGKSDDAVLEVGLKVPNHKWIIDYARIRPGLSIRIEPTQVDTLYIRSTNKPGRYSIRVFPL